MSIIKLTKDLENFKWTNYSNVGDNNSPITREHERAQFDTPQSFYDGHSQVVTGKQKFDRPNEGALADMESRFGPLNTQPGNRGPYSVADYMYGRQTGRGFTAPGQAPLGFTVDMQSLTADVKSEIEIDGDLSLTPLSYVVAGVNSALDYGVVPEKIIDITPDAYGAYGVNVLPISSYTSRILSREELEDYTSAPVGGRGVSYYGRLESLYNKNSMFQKEDGTYTTPIGQSTIPGSQTEFQNFMEFGGRGIQRTFEISREYPNNTTAYTIDTQFGSTFENKLLEIHGSAVIPDIPSDKYNSLPAMITMGKVESLFYLNYGDSDGVWPYHTLGFTGTHPLIKKEIGDRIPIGGGQNWMALQVLKSADDINRIETWLDTPAGQLFQDKQHILQELSPREETRDWSKSNLILSIPPLFHATRHFGGETYMEKADFGPIIDGDSPQGTSIGSLFSGTKFGKWVGEVATKIGDKMEAADTAIGGAVAGLNSAFGGIDFNDEGGRLQFLTDKMIKQIPDDGGFGGLMTNMRSAYSPFGRPPKVPTQVVFSQKGAFGVGDAHTAVNTVQEGTLLSRYKSHTYGDIPKSPMKLGLKGRLSAFQLNHQRWESSEAWVAAAKLRDDLKIEKEQLESIFELGNLPTDSMDESKIYENYEAAKTEEERLRVLWEADHKKFQNYKYIATTGMGEQGQQGIPKSRHKALPGLVKQGPNQAAGGQDIKYGADKVNIHPYGKDLPEGVSDFIKFKFYDVTNEKFIIFRAILSGISDSITPEWSGTEYIGRPDKVYVYKGAERKISFNFEIYPKTKQEFPVLLEKMNYLVGLCYPSFTSGNRMVAPFINLTIGDMFVETPGFLDSLSVEVDDTGTWEMQEGLQFPKHITCNCSFTYIGKYLPSSLGKHYELPWLEDYGWKSGIDGQAATYGTFQAADAKDTSTGKYPMKDQPERTRNMNLLMNPEKPNAE